jgi:hypothetical protein
MYYYRLQINWVFLTKKNYKYSSYLTRNTADALQNISLMLFRERFAVYSETRIKYRNAFCEENSDLVNAEQVARI